MKVEDELLSFVGEEK